MTDFGGVAEFTTWDGEPVSRERPHGVTIVVGSRSPDGWRYLLLHRAHHGPAWDGNWAWTPPAGSRKPGEDLADCASRELAEEAGLLARPAPIRTGDIEWAVYALEVPWGTAITVDGTEHDRLEWVSYSTAVERVRPELSAASFRAGAGALDRTP